MRTSAVVPTVAALALGVAGCATFRPGAGFPDVQGFVNARSRERMLQWDQGTEADRRAEEFVRAVLSKELTSEGAVQVALLRNRDLRTVYARLGIAQADLVQAGLLQNPILTADVRFGLNGGGTGAAVGLVQEFVSILQIPLRKHVAAAAFEETKLSVAAAVLELAVQVKRAFVRVQGAEQMLELRRHVVDAAAAAADVADRQHRAGNITDLDLASERALYEQARVELADAEAQAFDEREELTALLGLWGQDTTWTIAPRLPELPREEVSLEGLESQAIRQRLDLAAARQQTQVLVESRRLTRFYGFVPEATVGTEGEREVETGVWSLGPAVSLPLPLFDQRQAVLAGADTRVQQSVDAHTALAVAIRSQVRRARARLVAARARAEHYRTTVLPLRERVVEQTQLEYNGMLVGIFQLLQSKREEIDAGRAYIEALRDYWTARADLEAALGAELPSAAGATEAPAATTSPPAQDETDETHRGHRHR